MKSFLCICLCALFYFVSVTQLFSQGAKKGKITDKETKLPVPFASIVYTQNSIPKGVISDVQGEFEINDRNVTSITVSCIGYKPSQVSLATKQTYEIELEPNPRELNEVVVTPANNPAVRIIKLALKNKDANNFMRYDNYKYRCYLKTVYDFKFPADSGNTDTVVLKRRAKLREKVVFISEIVMECRHSGNLTENKIVAQKTSGVKNHVLAQFIVSGFHNSISFYENNVTLFQEDLPSDKSWMTYLSPLSDNCLSLYNYQLDGGYSEGADSIFVVNFYPKSGKNFNSLKGSLFISSNGYAIKNIVVEPYETGLVGFRFRQDYNFVAGKWFPGKLDEEIGLVKVKMGNDFNAFPYYLITAYIDSVSYSSLGNEEKINPEKIYIDKKSLKVSDSIIIANRPDTLNLREIKSYIFMDSVSKRYPIEYFISSIPKLSNGKLPAGFLDIDIKNIYTKNKHEGIRAGLSLSTNEMVFRNLSFGGFFAYGFDDKKLKYGGRVVWDINKEKEIQLRLLYQDNLKEAGRDVETGFSDLNMTYYLRRYMAYRFDEIVEKKASVNFRLFRYLRASASLSLKKMQPTYNYTFKNVVIPSYVADEFQFSVRYAHGAIFQTIGTEKVQTSFGNPIFNFNYRKGINMFTSRSFVYNRYEASMDVIAYSGRIGQSTIRLEAGMIDKVLPYNLLFTGDGSKNNSSPFLVTNSFQTMRPYEFLSDRYVNLFYLHNFGSLLFSTRKFKPQFVVAHNTGWGELQNPAHQGIDFRIKDKVFLESGLIINNLVRFNIQNFMYLGFGAGGFYRYGNYGYQSVKDNLAIKFSVTVTTR